MSGRRCKALRRAFRAKYDRTPLTGHCVRTPTGQTIAAAAPTRIHQAKARAEAVLAAGMKSLGLSPKAAKAAKAAAAIVESFRRDVFRMNVEHKNEWRRWKKACLTEPARSGQARSR